MEERIFCEGILHIDEANPLVAKGSTNEAYLATYIVDYLRGSLGCLLFSYILTINATVKHQIIVPVFNKLCSY